MMKLGWGLIANKDALWARVIRSKYNCGEDLMPNIRLGKIGSRVWSGIKNVWENVKNEIEIVQMNGESKGKWRLDRSGQFSVKSAYSSLVNIAPQDSRHWQDI